MLGTLFSYLKVVLSPLTAVIMMISSLICPTPAATKKAEITNEFGYSLVDAFLCGQGLDEEGDLYYTSGSLSAIKICCLGIIDKATGEVIKENLDALPQEFKNQDYNHIGDISVQNGIIYAPVENEPETHPLVLLYDAETLEYTGTFYAVDWEYLKDGIAWCATDEYYLYTSQFNEADRIVVYNIDDMSFSHTVELSETLFRVQAGDVLDGKAYLNCDPKGENKTVYEVDLATGETKLLFDRNTTGYDTEAEGLSVMKDENNELVFTISDYNKLVSTFIRTYKLK
ncbi:MAG: hypothetical protein IJ289_00805 [Clostridia bacterium]|nr:hypothetical protein [Clostridia bacterium]